MTEISEEARFVLRRPLGEGGMGVVHVAFDRERGAEVALKTLTRLDPVSLSALKNEFRALADLTHPNLVALHELVSESGSWFLSMEIIDGVSFLEHVRRGAAQPGRQADQTTVNVTISVSAGPSTLRSTLPLASTVASAPTPTTRLEAPACNLEVLRPALRQLLLGVAAIHGAGQLHRDLKPSNVLVTGAGRVVILDFGLAMAHRGCRTEPAAGRRVIVGTPEYMAPEQAAGDPAGPASDCYAVGLMLFEALTGQLPFVGDMRQILLAKRWSDARSPHALAAGIPDDLAQICADCLRRAPELRPTASELLLRLDGEAERAAGLDPAARLSSPSQPSPISGGDRLSTPIPSSGPPQGVGPFIGRESELRALHDAFRATREGRPVTAYVSGPSGMGKSALVEHFLDALFQTEDAVILSGRCYERESVPYKAALHRRARRHGAASPRERRGPRARARAEARGAVSLDGLILERVDALSAEARRLLEIYAVAARPIAQGLAAAAAELDSHDVTAQRSLRAARLVRSRGAKAHDVAEVYHDRIREVVAGALDPARNRACHARLASALEATGQADPEVLAVHCEGAGDLARAGRFAAVAADRAAGALAFERAARLYRLALGWHVGEAEPTRALRVKLADALVNAGLGAEAAVVFLEAARGAEPSLALELQRRAAEQLLVSGHIDRGVHVLRAVLASVGMDYLVCSEVSLLWLGRLAELAEFVRTHVREALERGDLFAATYARMHTWYAPIAADDVSRAGAEMRDAIARWSTGGFHIMHFWALYAEAQYELYAGRAAAAWSLLDRAWPALVKSNILRVQFHRIFMTLLRGSVAVAAAVAGPQGERKRLLKEAERAMSQLESESTPCARPAASLLAASLLAARGRSAEARGPLELACAGFDAADMTLHAEVARRRLGDLVGGETGRALIQRADALMGKQGIKRPERWTALHSPGF
jgi:serine/threonine protein kinase